MKTLISLSYRLISWLVLLILFLSFTLLFFLESPSTLFKALKAPLKEQGIEYGKMEGSLLTGFVLHDVNYQNQVKAKSLALKVDLYQLQNRVLYIDKLELNEAEIDKEFLASLVDANTTQEENNESNISLPFDYVIVNAMQVSIKNSAYQNYHVNKAELKVNGLETDMKTKHQGKISLMLDSNVSQLKLDGEIENNNYTLKANVEGEEAFINPILEEFKLKLPKNPKLDIALKGDLKKLDFDVKTEILSLNYEAYKVETEALNLLGYYDLEKQDVKVKLHSQLDANVAKLKMDTDAFVNLNDINNSLKFDVNTLLKPKKILANDALLKQVLTEQNISIESFPNMLLLAKGDMQNVDFKTTLDSLKIRQNKMEVEVKNFDLKGQVSPLKGDTELMLLTQFDGSVAKGNLETNSSFNFKALETSLNFEVTSDLEAYGAYLNPLLKEHNVTIKDKVPLVFSANGDMQNVDFETTLKRLKVSQNQINIEVKDFDLKGKTSPLKGETEFMLLTQFDGSVAKGNLETNSSFNFKDLETTLSFEVKSALEAYDAYLNTLLKEHNISIRGATPLAFEARGNMKAMKLKAEASSTLSYEEIESKVDFATKEITVNLEKEEIDGALELKAKGKVLALALKSAFSGNYMDPQKLKSDTALSISKFNAFGINLSSLLPLNMNVMSASKGAKADLEAKGLALKVRTLDYNNIDFFVKSSAIYPSKIMELPEIAEGKFIKLDLEGDVSITEQYFTLQGLLESNKNFKTKVNAFSKAEGLKVNLATKHLTLTANGDLKSKNIQAKLEVDSLKKLQQELLTLYPFTPVELDGALSLDARLQGEKVWANVNSEKIAFPAFFLEEVQIETAYDKEVVTINKLNFKTRGFKDAKLNQNFYLNQKGYVHLGAKKKLLLDIHPKILLKANGDETNLKATIQIEELPLGYPEYGETRLSCDIDYLQEGEKKKILGGVFLDKLKVYYESKFLDPSQDNDVVIVNKEKTSQEQRDSFLQDTAIDLGIYAGEGEYKTKEIELDFDVNLKAEKKFGKNLGILGKIEGISGRVEQSPKLFTVIDSNIVFQGREEINPLLDLTVEHELPDVLITINIHGNAKRPKLTFTSEPALPKKDILSYLLLGVSTASLGEGEGSLGREAQLFIMNQAARDLAYEVELDRVFVKDDGTGEGYAVQVGKKLNDDTMFVIENSTEGNSFILEYDVSKNIKVEVGQHQKTVPSQSIDIYFRKKFK